MSQGAEAVAARMAAAAADFLDSLDDGQRSAAAWPFPSEERLRWYYTPTDHGGLPLSGMRPSQQQLAFRLLAAGLSHPAYVTACVIVGLENVLDGLEGWSMRWERERGRDPGLYYVRVFGDPRSEGPWSWRFGGHHVSVHHLVVDGSVRASTPSSWAPTRRSHRSWVTPSCVRSAAPRIAGGSCSTRSTARSESARSCLRFLPSTW
jgi:hypothetical protein